MRRLESMLERHPGALLRRTSDCVRDVQSECRPHGAKLVTRVQKAHMAARAERLF